MKQLFLTKENLIIKETVQPILHEFSLLVAVHYAYITAQTDVTMIETAGSFFNNLPHKVKRVLDTVSLHTGGAIKDQSTKITCVGQVIAVGKKVTKFGPGDFVACLNTSYFHHTDLVCVAEFYAVKLANHSYLKQATLIPFATGALQTIRRANIHLGEQVGVFGLGLIGLLTVQLARIAGCSVIAFDTDQHSLAVAAALGATPLHMTNDEIAKEVYLMTEHHGLDALFVTHNAPSLFEQAIKVTCSKGRLILLSDGVSALHQTNALIDMNIIIARDIFEDTLDDGDACMHWADNHHMRACLSLMEQGILVLDSFIEDQVSVEKLSSAYERIQKKLSIGALITYEQSIAPGMLAMEKTIPSKNKDEKRFIPAAANDLRVGFIGINQLMNDMVIPLISKMKNVTIKGFFDDDTKKSMALRDKYVTAQRCTKEEMMTTDVCDVLMIATPHALHAEQALQALEQGKAVFLERPMVTNFQQLQQLMAYLAEHKKAPLCVGYSYSFAPFVKKIKKVIQKRRTPLMAHYRLNRELKYYERQLVNTSMNAGRIIGDTVQIVDLFCHLTDSLPISVSVSSIHSPRDDIFPTDNVATHITFHDGSLCSFLYTTLGHPDISTDRLEIYYDGKAIVMEDYTELYGFGLTSSFNETVATPDRGYEAMVTQFFKALQQDTFSASIPLERLQMVAQLTLIIDELACEGGGKKEIQKS